MNPTIVQLIPASTKKQELSPGVHIDPRIEIQCLQKDVAKQIEKATRVPFSLKPKSYEEILFCVDIDYTELSNWLRNAGYCLSIEYTDTGNNDTIDRVMVNYYEDRGYDEEEAIVVHERKNVSPPTFM